MWMVGKGNSFNINWKKKKKKDKEKNTVKRGAWGRK